MGTYLISNMHYICTSVQLFFAYCSLLILMQPSIQPVHRCVDSLNSWIYSSRPVIRKRACWLRSYDDGVIGRRFTLDCQRPSAQRTIWREINWFQFGGEFRQWATEKADLSHRNRFRAFMFGSARLGSAQLGSAQLSSALCCSSKRLRGIILCS